MNRQRRRAIVSTLAAAGIIVPAQAKLWKPNAPAIIRASTLREIAPIKAMLPGFCIPMVTAVAAASAPSFVAAGTSSSGTANPSPTYPAGIAANDILVLWVMANSPGTVGAVSGFTAETQVDNGTNNVGARFFWKRATGSESGSQSVTVTGGAGNNAAIIAAYRGCVTSGTPYEGFSCAQSNADANTTHVSPATTTLGANRLVVRLWAFTENAGVAVPSGYTEDFESVDSTNFLVLTGDSKPVASASTEPASTRTYASGFNTASLAAGLAFIPA